MRWLISLFLIVLVSLTLDLRLSHVFFDGGAFAGSSFYDFIYDFGTFPGWILAFHRTLCPFYQNLAKRGAFLVLVLAIGSGLFAHFVLKEGWPRPRPQASG